MSGIKDYSTTPASNTALFPEGMAPSAVNDSARQVQADIREWYNDSEWVIYGDGDGSFTAAYASATSFTINGANVTAKYHTGRRIKAVGSATGTIYGTISSSSFSTDTTVNVTWDSGSLSNEALTIYLGAMSATNSSFPPSLAISLSSANTFTAKQTFTKSVETAKGANVASATTTDIWTPADGNTVHITGTNTITGFGTAPQAGAWRWVIFDGALTLTHGANLDLPGNANKTTASGDRALVYADTTTAMIVLVYVKDNGQTSLTDLDINGATLVANPADAGFIAGYDSTAAANRKFRIGEVGGWVPLEEATASASAALNFVLSGYTADFEDFEFIATGLVPATDGVNLWMRFSTDGGATYDSGAGAYRYSNLGETESGLVTNLSASDTHIEINVSALGSGTGEEFHARVQLHNPADTAKRTMAYWSGGSLNSTPAMTTWTGSGQRVTAQDTDAVRFLMSSGNITSGKIVLMGRRKVT